MDVTFELEVLSDLSQGRNLLLGFFSDPENGVENFFRNYNVLSTGCTRNYP
jgi:hypothetical protein